MNDNDTSNMGRPKINGGVVRVLVTMTPAHRAYLQDTYGSISPAIRALIDADIASRGDDAETPSEQEGDDRENEK